jgi:hypothetical protein
MSEIGYGKPPQHTRFKKGTSGNPKGRRPRDPMDWGRVMQEVLEEIVKVQINGEVVSLTGRRAICRQIRNKAIAGNIPAAKLTMDIEKQDEKSDPDETEPLTVIVRRYFPEDDEKK